jgi:NhaA family Na+:H+ antiporter
VAFLILPLFALANTGVTVDLGSVRELASDNGLGIALGLVLGKPLGVVLLSFIAVKAGMCVLPGEVRWSHLVGAGIVGGIGFTMSIFITNLAFAGDPALINASKLSVLAASVTAGLLGYFWLRWGTFDGAEQA